MTFMRQIYANGGKGFFDAFAHHPYSFPCNPLTDASWNAFTQTKYLHDIMVQNGDGAKKIWGTEAGAPTGADIGTCATSAIGTLGERGARSRSSSPTTSRVGTRTTRASPARCSGSRSATTAPTR